MRARFRTASEPLAFAAGIRRRPDAAQATPVVRVLRRVAQTVLQRLWMPLHFALQVALRCAAPWSTPCSPVIPRAPAPSEQTVRERFHLSTRLLERSLRVLQLRELRTCTRAAPGADAPSTTAPSPVRVLTVQRIERRTLFPRVTQVLSRPAPVPPAPVQAELSPSLQRSDTSRAPRPQVLRNALPISTSLGPVELGRVADHVIRELDRRVLSYRERTGQV
jgi:hypothetical protein